METYYEILGLSRKHTKEQLALAYLVQACAFHPQHSTATADTRERFRLTGEAFCVLYDAKMRFGYDKHLASDPLNELGRRVVVSIEHMETLFVEMTRKYAKSSLGEEDDPEVLIEELVVMNCPETIAREGVTHAYGLLRVDIQWAAWKIIGFGLIFLAPGAYITLYSMSKPNVTVHPGWLGPMFIGAAYAIYGMTCLSGGRRPARITPIDVFMGKDSDK